MKIKITKNDFAENGGKLFLSYLDILNQWESEGVGKTLPTLTEKIAKKLLIDHGFNDSGWSQQKHTLQSAGRQIRKLFISKKSAKKNFDIDIEFDTVTGDIKIIDKTSNPESEQEPVDEPKESGPPKEGNSDNVEDFDKAGNASNDTISYLSLPASPEMPSGLCEHVMDKIDEVIQKLESSVTENVETSPSLAIKSEAVFESTNLDHGQDDNEVGQPPNKKRKSSKSEKFNEKEEVSKTQPLDLRTGGEQCEAKMTNCSVVIPKLE